MAFAAEGAPVFGLELAAGGRNRSQWNSGGGQGGASTYKPSTTGGVYEGARFRDDILAITATGVNRHAATVNIIHANHL